MQKDFADSDSSESSTEHSLSSRILSQLPPVLPVGVGRGWGLAVVGLVLSLAEPSKEGSDRLEGHTLALLLGRVFARFPLVEGLLFDHVLIVQSVKEHPQQI